VRPDGLVAIAVASGDAGTGDLSAAVTTSYPKGITMVEAIEDNLLLPWDDVAIAENSRMATEKTDDTPVMTYFLLHNRRNGTMYSELSRPQSIDKKGFVTSWAPRIPLSARPLGPVVISEDAETPLAAEVPVKRRDQH